MKRVYNAVAFPLKGLLEGHTNGDAAAKKAAAEYTLASRGMLVVKRALKVGDGTMTLLKPMDPEKDKFNLDAVKDMKEVPTRSEFLKRGAAKRTLHRLLAKVYFESMVRSIIGLDDGPELKAEGKHREGPTSKGITLVEVREL